MPTKFKDLKPSAEFDGTEYRYTWSYAWDEEKPRAAWLMMNPSFADQDVSDRTVDRVLHFSREHGCGSVTVVNLWPKITSKSGEMWRAIPTVPIEKLSANLERVNKAGAAAQLRIVAFGVDAGRDHQEHALRMVEGFGDQLYCLGTSSDGWPNHPMARGKGYIPNDRQLVPWVVPS